MWWCRNEPLPDEDGFVKRRPESEDDDDELLDGQEVEPVSREISKSHCIRNRKLKFVFVCTFKQADKFVPRFRKDTWRRRFKYCQRILSSTAARKASLL